MAIWLLDNLMWSSEVQNPFQHANLKQLPWWRSCEFTNQYDEICEELLGGLQKDFSVAVETGKFSCFAEKYNMACKVMKQEMPNEALLAFILESAFKRLVTMYAYLRQRKNSPLRFLSNDDSVLSWTLDQNIISGAVKQADKMERAGVRNSRFNLKSSPRLLAWIYRQYWPIVRRFAGSAVMPLVNAHIRCVTSERHGAVYRDRYQYHRFGNHHYDEDVYSLPLIVYLGEVGDNCGPFEYIDHSDKYTQNYILRAFHQAVNHDCELSSLEDDSFSQIAQLPAVFRGGSVFGNFYSDSDFIEQGNVVVTGKAGTATMFNGFNLIHTGGFPKAGCRKSLFINCRFPLAKLAAKYQYRKHKRLVLGRE